MVGWIILGVIVLLITAINMIRIGADIGYEAGVLSLSAKVAGFMLQLLPKQDKGEKRPKKEKAPKKKKEKKEKPESEEPEKKGLPLGLSMDELFELLKAVLTRLGRFPGQFRIDRFLLHVCVAGKDPYNTAMTYGHLNECLSILAPLARRSFTVKKSDVWTDVDFTTDKLFFEAGLVLSIRIGQIVRLLLSIVFAAAGVVIRSKLRQKKEAKAALRAEKTQAQQTDIDHLQEERTDSNG